ncbi:MAG: type II toxin-antitoxin system VapC family toxin [Verrucomicrobiaceae bacterium]|nr:MAG: type II toxin-antitoxin system VapC family toxin [Verrucomicrobiaceae bacterium]
MAWLLDTNAVSVLLNQRSAPLVSRVASCSMKELFLCSVVKGELIYGAWNSPDPVRTLTKLDSIFRKLESLPFDDRAAEFYGRIHADLSSRGARIGPHDTMIAAIALANNLILVTHNVREFSRVSGLAIEDWQI